MVPHHVKSGEGGARQLYRNDVGSLAPGYRDDNNPRAYYKPTVTPMGSDGDHGPISRGRKVMVDGTSAMKNIPAVMIHTNGQAAL